MNFELTLSTVGVVLAVPGAWVAFLDARHNRNRTRRPPVVQGAVQYAAITPLSLPRRWLSAIIDFYSAAIVGGFVQVVLNPVPDGSEISDEAIAIGYVIAWILLAWNASTNGRSLGRLVVGGRLVRADNPYRPVNFGVALIRLPLAALLNSVLFFSVLVGLGSPERRTLHDLMTGSRVISVR